MQVWLKGMLGCAAAMAVTACDNGPSAVANAPPAESAGELAAQGLAVERSDPRDAPVEKIDGKPMWSASRRYTAEENAERAFARNGETFGAKDQDDFVKQAHAFVNDPPKSAETIKRRNGDVLIYDAKTNVFAVRTAEGAPRTMFKPDDGPAYWAEQKDREARRTANAGAGEEREAG